MTVIPKPERSLRLQVALTLLGATVACVRAASWRDGAHLLYDIPANLAVFGFIAQLVAESLRGGFSRRSLAGFGLVAAMTLVAGGREFAGWGISGHLSCVLAVAVVQAFDVRLARIERALYWIPLPVVLALRWLRFDEGSHDATWRAMAFGLAAGLLAAFVGRERSGLPSAAGRTP